ncbi:FAD-dependent monooxygenase [Streptomyces sp. XM4193]|uniref:FAD-dependent monooxygenase n=1 Tax=Streptomyces sp. XM4193 TaxID=2929782 RepID=UPI001FFBA504|nr:FAD-dependent monooxygenase [Streptomyces sp. XM4193]MCK1798564.1 FAD-dependent monooxygenase [Streptomyces sp. XM4193]
MSSSHLRIAVVGAGVGGLTLAAALTRAGVPCTVHEQADRLSEVGAGLQLAPNAVRLLHRLGLADALGRRAVRPLSRDIRRWDDDRLLSRTVLGAECEARYGAPYTTVHRADLHAALLAVAGDSVRTGHRLSGLAQRPDGVVLRFADGTVEEADVVVGADGIRSTVRAELTRDAPEFSGQFIYRGLVPAEAVPGAADEPRVRIWLGPGRHCVCYPVSGGRSLSFAATAPGDGRHEESWTGTAEPGEAVAAYRGWNSTVVSLLDAAGTVGRWALHDRPTLERWSTDRITVLGDAAHPMLPFASQGANQAIEDAMALAACLVRSGSDAPAAALRRYASVRAPRTGLLQKSSRERTEAMHLPDGPRQRERDTGFAGTGGLREEAWLYGYDTLAAVARAAG